MTLDCCIFLSRKGDIMPISLQIFEEEHNVWFLDKGGALVAVKQPTVPTRHLWYVHLQNFFGLLSLNCFSFSYF